MCQLSVAESTTYHTLLLASTPSHHHAALHILVLRHKNKCLKRRVLELYRSARCVVYLACLNVCVLKEM